MFKTTAFDVSRQEEQAPKIITLCRSLDEHLGGGLQSGMITELCGASGTGKTQLCLQLCINVQFPKEVGGLCGKAIFVDTNQGFHPERLKEIAFCTDERFQKTFGKLHTSPVESEIPFNTETMLENVSYTYCGSHEQLLATVINLKTRLSQDPALKLIIIDSFAFLLRRIDDMDERFEIIYDLVTDLYQLAIEFQIVIVITNELTTRVTDNQWNIVPALGDSHAHLINQRIILQRPEHPNAPFVALVQKSVVVAKVAIPFQINQSGIRGVS